MIIECKPSNIDEILSECRKDNLAYLDIVRKNDIGLIISYKLVSDFDENDQKLMKKLIKNSINYTINLIGKLNQLRNMLINNVKIYSFKLLFDATCAIEGSNKIKFDHSYSCTKESIDKANKNNIWKEVLDQKLVDNTNVPGIYKKISSKKYIPVTYSELVQAMKEYVDNKNE